MIFFMKLQLTKFACFFFCLMQYITRQLETVRDSSESRMRIYEELDRTSQDLEKTNQRLLIDAKTDKQRIEKSVYKRTV